MNKVILIGNLTRDPEKSTTNSGLSVCKFSIAVSRSYSREKEADYFTVITWRTLADNCADFLKKGSKVAVSGSIQNRSYDGNDGNKHYVTEIIADEVQFLTTKGQAPEDGTPVIGDATAPDTTNMKPVGDGLPF